MVRNKVSPEVDAAVVGSYLARLLHFLNGRHGQVGHWPIRLVTFAALEEYSMKMIMISGIHLQLQGNVSEQYTVMACL